MTSFGELSYEDDIPTAKTCAECKGDGFVTVERADGTYRGERCRWCRGTGRAPLGSGTFQKTDPR